MRSLRSVFWILLGFATAASAGALLLQRQETSALREQLALWQDSGRELEKLRTENERLKARQPSPAELAAIRTRSAEVERKRQHIEQLKQQMLAAERKK